jgi:hypothetical protein
LNAFAATFSAGIALLLAEKDFGYIMPKCRDDVSIAFSPRK